MNSLSVAGELGADPKAEADSSAMLRLIGHVIRTSCQRDRTEINTVLIEALADLFQPLAIAIFRVFTSRKQTVVFACAESGAQGRYVRNAYRPDTAYCRPIHTDAVLQRCQRQLNTVVEVLADGRQRLVFPITQAKHLIYLIDITVAENLAPDQRTLMMRLVEYFGHHIALLDYGETDTLTGLPNRKTFDKHLFEVLDHQVIDEPPCERKRRRKGGNDSQHWLAVCDIDHFKRVNDEHGHLIGDEVLIMFAHLMRDNFRYQDQLFRFGGEEFVVVLQPTGETVVRQAFERLRLAVERHVFTGIGHITVSIGYSRLYDNDTAPDVIERADEALYYIKQHGRNAVACYEDLVNSGQLRVKVPRSGDIELF
ncbi:MAG TPA: GGDEF domain-containing protein [Accumulibacter sp.]|nr:GGDEF domain-containing protein [Accumulibacter sp.]